VSPEIFLELLLHIFLKNLIAFLLRHSKSRPDGLLRATRKTYYYRIEKDSFSSKGSYTFSSRSRSIQDISIIKMEVENVPVKLCEIDGEIFVLTKNDFEK